MALLICQILINIVRKLKFLTELSSFWTVWMHKSDVQHLNFLIDIVMQSIPPRVHCSVNEHHSTYNQSLFQTVNNTVQAAAAALLLRNPPDWVPTISHYLVSTALSYELMQCADKFGWLCWQSSMHGGLQHCPTGMWRSCWTKNEWLERCVISTAIVNDWDLLQQFIKQQIIKQNKTLY